MTPPEQAEKIEEIYNEAIQKLEQLSKERDALVKERKDIISGYIKELEAQKLSAIQKSLKI